MNSPYRAVCGGAWFASKLDFAFHRGRGVASLSNLNVGFRCAKGTRMEMNDKPTEMKPYDFNSLRYTSRGGSWLDMFFVNRASHRNREEPDYIFGDSGFRCARGSR